ncbi:MAG TPA: L-threonylcarbamoyladenylate synthase [Thermoanaerobaculia bacterium]
MSGPPIRIWRWGDPLGPLAALLARGGVLAVPTESSYALAADPRNPEGVAAVYRIKRRGAGKPLPVVAAGLGQLAGLGIDPDLPILAVLAHAAWPGPLTAVLPLTRPLPAAAGLPSLAVRVPAHDRLRTLLAELGSGLTATSANHSGGAPAREPSAAAALLAGEDAALVDDGPLPGGPPSTIVRWTPEGLEVLRRGSFPAPGLAALLAANKSNLPPVVGTYEDSGVAGSPRVPRKIEEEP